MDGLRLAVPLLPRGGGARGGGSAGGGAGVVLIRVVSTRLAAPPASPCVLRCASRQHLGSSIALLQLPPRLSPSLPVSPRLSLLELAGVLLAQRRLLALYPRQRRLELGQLLTLRGTRLGHVRGGASPASLAPRLRLACAASSSAARVCPVSASSNASCSASNDSLSRALSSCSAGRRAATGSTDSSPPGGGRFRDSSGEGRRERRGIRPAAALLLLRLRLPEAPTPGRPLAAPSAPAGSGTLLTSRPGGGDLAATAPRLGCSSARSRLGLG